MTAPMESNKVKAAKDRFAAAVASGDLDAMMQARFNLSSELVEEVLRANEFELSQLPESRRQQLAEYIWKPKPISKESIIDAFLKSRKLREEGEK